MAEQTSNAITPYDRIKNIMRSDEIRERFAEAIGKGQAGAYISSVLIAVQASNSLQGCEAKSIIASAMRAATLRLSCDPATGQAYLVPFKGKATLVVGYRGLVNLALRTGKYRILNVAKEYAGEQWLEDRLTGLHKLAGERESDEITGYLFYMELFTGFRKSIYMSRQEIHDHARKYSKSYGDANSAWTTNTQAMEEKTIVRLSLMHWGYMDPNDAAMIQAADENDGEEIEADYEKLAEDRTPPITQAQAMNDLGFETQSAPPLAPIGYSREVAAAAQPTPETLADRRQRNWRSTQVSWEMAATITNSKNARYVDISPADLKYPRSSLVQVMGDMTVDTPEKQAEYTEKQLKLDTIDGIQEADKVTA